MYDRHFLRREYAVRIGGWKIARWRFGSGVYIVTPLSVRTVFQLPQALVALRIPETVDPIGTALALGVAVLRPFVRFVVAGEIKDRHLRRLAPDQLEEILKAVQAANDIPYIVKAMSPPKDKETKGQDFSAFVLAVVAALHGARNEDEVSAMPFQKALAILDAARELSGVPTEPISPEKRADIEAQLRSIGAVVVN